MRKSRKGFTLTEMAVVMGMIVLFIGIAIPTVRALTGQSSINMARNQLASLFVRVREEAVAMQDVRGVLFILEPATDRIICVTVQPSTCVDLTQNRFPMNMVMLDAEPNRDSVVLPLGVRLQTMFNGLDRTQSSTGNEDRYLGFNPVIPQAPNSNGSQYQRYYGGCVLFDGNGTLVVRPYALQLMAPGLTANTFQQSNLATLLGFDATNNPVPTSATGSAVSFAVQSGSSSFAIVPGATGTSPSSSDPFVVSQVGLILFDGDAFKTLGFTDDDADLIKQSYSTPWASTNISEKTEETWLDTHSTPVMINRFDGTLIKGE